MEIAKKVCKKRNLEKRDLNFVSNIQERLLESEALYHFINKKNHLTSLFNNSLVLVDIFDKIRFSALTKRNDDKFKVIRFNVYQIVRSVINTFQALSDKNIIEAYRSII